MKQFSNKGTQYVKNLIKEVLQFENTKEAIAYLNKRREGLTSHGEKIEYALIKYCDALKERNLWQKAAEVGEHLSTEFPNNWTGHHAYAAALEELQEYEKAIAAVRKIPNFRQERDDCWYTYCRLLHKSGQTQKAIDEFDQLTKIKQFAKPDRLFEYAMVLKDAKKIQEMQRILGILIKRNGNHWLALYTLGHSFQLDDGNYQDSINLLEYVLVVIFENNPKEPERTDIAKIYHQLGICYSNLGETRAATECFQWAKELDEKTPASSGLAKVRETDRFIGKGKNFKFLASEKAPNLKLQEELRQVNRARWQKLHGQEKKIESLISVIDNVEKKKTDQSKFDKKIEKEEKKIPSVNENPYKFLPTDEDKDDPAIQQVVAESRKSEKSESIFKNRKSSHKKSATKQIAAADNITKSEKKEKQKLLQQTAAMASVVPKPSQQKQQAVSPVTPEKEQNLSMLGRFWRSVSECCPPLGKYIDDNSESKVSRKKNR